MKRGYYLSIYAEINSMAYIYKIGSRHDHHMILWKLDNNKLDLVHYWEFERITGIKKHDIAFFDNAHSEEFINSLLYEYKITLEDIVEIWGTPPFSGGNSRGCNNKEISSHSVYHLFSSMMIDSEVFKNGNIIALALDAGPDNIEDNNANMKKFYAGAYSQKGDINLFSIASPACIWANLAGKYGMQEGSLMALGSASKSRANEEFLDIYKDFIDIRDYKDTYLIQKWVERIIWKMSQFQNEDEGISFNFWDTKFSEEENKISMVVKIVQKLSVEMVERQIERIINEFEIDSTDTYLAIAGGYGLNCPTNSYLMKKYNFKGFLASPCVSDCGVALGMGLYNFYNAGINNLKFCLKNAYYGDSDDKLEEIISLECYKDFIESVSKFDEKVFVDDIEKEPIVWFSGRAEIGPRALGNRSILADPRSLEAKKRLNDIKQRQWWRPVAPIILEEALPHWFEANYPSEFMLMTYKIKENKKKLVPAAIHADDSARVQTVNSLNYIPYTLVNAFYKRTGIPILCNTSLNDRGEPIINKIPEAINFALRKSIIIIYINSMRIVLKNHNLYTVAEPEKRKNFYIKNDSVEVRREINPYNLSYEELEVYLRNPQLSVFNIRNLEHVKQLKDIIEEIGFVK